MRKPSQKLPHISPFLDPKYHQQLIYVTKRFYQVIHGKRKYIRLKRFFLRLSIVDDVFHANKIGRSHHIFARLADHLSDTSDKENLLSLKQKRSNWFQFHHFFSKDFSSNRLVWKEDFQSKDCRCFKEGTHQRKFSQLLTARCDPFWKCIFIVVIHFGEHMVWP